MAELGQTQDPRQLVPGDPDALRTTANSLKEYGNALVLAGDGLRRIDDGGWRGEAADNFRKFFDGEPARWTGCGDSFHAADEALVSYASTLAWAQDEARDAIDLWARGEAETRKAKDAYNRAQQGENPSTAPFQDPGESLRQQARDKLGRARGQVGSAGHVAGGKVAKATEKAPKKPNLFERAVDDVRDLVGDGIRAVGETIADGMRFVGDGVDTVLDKVGDAADTVISGAGDLVGDGLETVGDLTGIDGISDAGKAVRDATDNAGDAVNDATDAAGDAVSNAADDAGDEVEDGADDVGDTADPDEDDDGQDEDHETDNQEDGDTTGDPDDDDPDGDDGGDGENEDVDRNGHWEDANGEKPDPASITTEGRRSHILHGDQYGGGHSHDSGVPGKTTFPEDWDDDKVMDEIEDVARNPDSPPVYDEDDEAWKVRGTRDGVDIEVIVQPDGQVRTGYPTGGEGVHRNDENGDPQPIGN